MIIDTWIHDELVSVDVEEAWLDTFALWDCLVPSSVAEEIATATSMILRRHALMESERSHTGAHDCTCESCLDDAERERVDEGAR